MWSRCRRFSTFIGGRDLIVARSPIVVYGHKVLRQRQIVGHYNGSQYDRTERQGGRERERARWSDNRVVVDVGSEDLWSDWRDKRLVWHVELFVALNWVAFRLPSSSAFLFFYFFSLIFLLFYLFFCWVIFSNWLTQKKSAIRSAQMFEQLAKHLTLK